MALSDPNYFRKQNYRNHKVQTEKQPTKAEILEAENNRLYRELLEEEKQLNEISELHNERFIQATN